MYSIHMLTPRYRLDDKEQRFPLLPELQLAIHEGYIYLEDVPPSLTWVDAVSLSLPPSFDLNHRYIWRLTTVYTGIWRDI